MDWRRGDIGTSTPTTLGPRVIRRTTPHLTFTAALSHSVVDPGTRMSITLDVIPKRGMHVYAPGAQYRPLVLALERSRWLRVDQPAYPKPTAYTFNPLDEQALVYSAPFRMVLSLTAVGFSDDQAGTRPRSSLTIKGMLRYQACDDAVCYLPTAVPLEWTVRVGG